MKFAHINAPTHTHTHTLARDSEWLLRLVTTKFRLWKKREKLPAIVCGFCVVYTVPNMCTLGSHYWILYKLKIKI